SARDLFRPEVAIELGAEYLHSLSEHFDSHPMLVIAGYNGGFGNVDRFIRENGRLQMDQWVEEIPFSQTRDYTKRVLMTYWIYHWLYSSDEPVLAIDFAPRTAP
ncbi:MAG: transglycosylase SLT domain-containing protein, partial [Myxococcales bacterium]|nr:transglycosylase SLT domain-containing protein [Myxococcales bacterium]